MKLRWPTLLIGGGLLVLLWVWLRNRSGAASTTPAPNFGGQVGSNIREDVSAEVVGRAFDFAGELIDRARCFRLVDAGLFASDHLALWVPSGEANNSPNGIRLPPGQIPRNACGY